MEGQGQLLQWTSHQGAILSVFNALLSTESHVDVTVASEGGYIRAHKVILSACSPYFQELLNVDVNKHPIFILKDVKYTELQALIQYMYRGEVRVPQEDLPSLLKVAQVLKIRGLVEMDGQGTNNPNTTNTITPITQPSLPPIPLSIPSNDPINQSDLPHPNSLPMNSESGEQIPLLFYSELLQNSEIQELLAGKITECLDARNNSGAEDEVVKAVSSMAEKDILDAFYKDFFEIELGGMDVEDPTTTTNPIPSDSHAGEAAIQQGSSTRAEVPSSAEAGVVEQVGRPNVIVEPIPSTIKTQPSSPSADVGSSLLTSPQDTKTSRRTFITVTDVTDDEYSRLKTGPPPPASELSSTKRKRTSYKKVNVVEHRSDTTVRVPSPPRSRTWTPGEGPKWTRLRRKTILPQHKNQVGNGDEGAAGGRPFQTPPTRREVPLTPSPIQILQLEESEVEVIPVVPPFQLEGFSGESQVVTPRTPLEHLSEETNVVVTSGSPYLAPPSPIGSDVVVMTTEESPPKASNPPMPTLDEILPPSPLLSKSALAQRELLEPGGIGLSEEIKNPTDPPISADKSILKPPMREGRSALSIALSRTARRLMEAQSQSPQIPVPSPFASLEKPLSSNNPDLIERKSLSTPRKRNRHVRNLQFKTPPSLRVESPTAHLEENCLGLRRDRREGTPPPSKGIKSKKKLEWTVVRSPPLEKILEQEEQGSFSSGNNGNGRVTVRTETTEVDPNTLEVPSTPLPHPPTPPPWIPPTTPGILSPRQCNSGWESPLSVQKVSPDHDYFRRLFGSPLPPGCVPITPGRPYARPPGRIGSDGNIDPTSFAPPPPLTPIHFWRNLHPLDGSTSTEKEKPEEGIPVSLPMDPSTKGEEEHPFRIPSNPDLDSAKPPKKRRRVGEGSQVTSPAKNSPPVGWVGGSSSSRVLRSKLTSTSSRSPQTRRIPDSPGSPQLLPPTPPILSPGVKRRVLALQKRSITFPESGFQFRTVLDRRPRISFKVNGRRRFISVSGRTTVLSLRNSSPLASSSSSSSSIIIPDDVPTPPGSELSQLLDKGPEVNSTTVRDQVEMRTYNKRGQLVKMSSPCKYTFQEHFNVLQGRTPSSSSSSSTTETTTITKG